MISIQRGNTHARVHTHTRTCTHFVYNHKSLFYTRDSIQRDGWTNRRTDIYENTEADYSSFIRADNSAVGACV